MRDAQLRMTGAILIAVALLIAGIDRASRATVPIVQSVRLPDAYTQQWAEHQAPRQKEQLNLNTASFAQLCTLPYMLEETAMQILQYRAENGCFSDTAELLQIHGIDEKTLARLQNDLYIA